MPKYKYEYKFDRNNEVYQVEEKDAPDIVWAMGAIDDGRSYEREDSISGDRKYGGEICSKGDKVTTIKYKNRYGKVKSSEIENKHLSNVVRPVKGKNGVSEY